MFNTGSMLPVLEYVHVYRVSIACIAMRMHALLWLDRYRYCSGHMSIPVPVLQYWYNTGIWNVPIML